MKSIKWSLLAVVILIALHTQGQETTTVQGRIETSDTQSTTVWIGVFTSPIKPGDDAWEWTLVESKEFFLDIPVADEVQIVALRRNSLPIVQQILPRSADTILNLKFEEGAELVGTVLSTDNLPVADAEVTMEREDLPQGLIPDPVRFSWNSDADGQFSIGGLAPNVDYEIEVRSQYVPRETFAFKIAENDSNNREFRLSDAFFVIGRVVDQDRVVVQEATVQYQPEGEEERPRTSTNEEGEFRVGPLVRNKQVLMEARHPEQGSSERLLTSAGDHNVELMLEGMVLVIGSVVDASTGESIDDFTLHATRADGSQDYPYAKSNGEVSSLVDTQTTGLTVDSEEYVPHFRTDLSLDSVDTFDLGVVALEPGRQLTGRVFDALTGEPIPGATVSLTDTSWIGIDDYLWLNHLRTYLHRTVQSITNEQGEYVLKSLPPDAVQIAVSARGYQSPDVQIDEAVTTYDIPLDKEKLNETRLIGRVENTEGDPLGGMVNLRTENSNAGYGIWDGQFDIPVEPGTYDVFATTDQGTSNTVQVSLQDGETRELKLIVDAKGRIAGVIAGLADGEVLHLDIYSESERASVRNVSGLENGEFSVEGVGIGEFKLTAESSRNREITKAVAVSEDTGEGFVELHFHGNSRLHGSLSFPDGTFPKGEVKAVAKKSGNISSSTEIDENGTFEIRGLDDGEYTVHVTESREITYELDGASYTSGMWTPIGQFDIAVEGDTEFDIQLLPPSDSE